MDAPISSPLNTRAASSAASSTQQSPTTNLAAPVPVQSQYRQPSTDAFLKDFNLVAEAAKRAQVAVMVRDFENCGL